MLFAAETVRGADVARRGVTSRERPGGKGEGGRRGGVRRRDGGENGGMTASKETQKNNHGCNYSSVVFFKPQRPMRLPPHAAINEEPHR